MDNKIGYEKGELCNRNGCQGIIDEHDSDGGCSCHISPPCSFCVDSREFCPVCGWDGGEEQSKTRAAISNFETEYTATFFKRRTFDDLDRNTIDYLNIGHTHFSMIKKGVFPEGSTRDQVESIVRGSFGGRFKSFDEKENTFEYVAYTD